MFKLIIKELFKLDFFLDQIYFATNLGKNKASFVCNNLGFKQLFWILKVTSSL